MRVVLGFYLLPNQLTLRFNTVIFLICGENRIRAIPRFIDTLEPFNVSTYIAYIFPIKNSTLPSEFHNREFEKYSCLWISLWVSFFFRRFIRIVWCDQFFIGSAYSTNFKIRRQNINPVSKYLLLIFDMLLHEKFCFLADRNKNETVDENYFWRSWICLKLTIKNEFVNWLTKKIISRHDISFFMYFACIKILCYLDCDENEMSEENYFYQRWIFDTTRVVWM